MKEEIPNRKLPQLQNLIDRVGMNDSLTYFRHTSSYSTTEFILLISDYLTDTILSDISHDTVWSSMVDESTDISTQQQYIPFIRYVRRGKVCVRFLDICSIDEHGTTADNLHKYWTNVAADYELNTRQHIGISCDGAASMLGKHKSLTQKLCQDNPAMVAIHCHAQCTYID